MYGRARDADVVLASPIARNTFTFPFPLLLLPLPPLRSVGVLQMQMGPLVDALRPAFERCLSDTTSLLPVLADEAYSAFIKTVGRGDVPERPLLPQGCLKTERTLCK